ncbi:hypothetical protein ACFW5X_28790, partial [Streptomyces albogriseolus]|uniref:hypothetical protein n=1 Tax=Streptomyces albogriseolus TaxID=1887 RepID=UPI0036C4BC6D
MAQAAVAAAPVPRKNGGEGLRVLLEEPVGGLVCSGDHERHARPCLIIDLVVGRGELTDAAWERIAPLLPGVD